jgi:hypothetical protein
MAAAIRYQRATEERDHLVADRMNALIAGELGVGPAPSLRVIEGG